LLDRDGYDTVPASALAATSRYEKRYGLAPARFDYACGILCALFARGGVIEEEERRDTMFTRFPLYNPGLVRPACS